MIRHALDPAAPAYANFDRVTLCGRHTKPLHVTEKKALVTCRACRKILLADHYSKIAMMTLEDR